MPLNYSHGEPEQKTELYHRIRALESKIGRPTCILADLPGPKLRLGEFEGIHVLGMRKKVELHCGISYMEDASSKKLPVQYAGLSAELKKGDPVLLADGLIRLKVLSTTGEAGGIVTCRIQDGGPISSRKGSTFQGPWLTCQRLGQRMSVLSSMRLIQVQMWLQYHMYEQQDLQPAKETIKKRGLSTWIVAKIEHPMALDHLDEILDIADAVMVARGDLGVEIPLEEVPIAQQKIIDSALGERGMPVIVATQMLETMTVNPRPTRAEVSDISTAIRQGATGVMLSGETASGKYPLKSVQTMAKIAQSTEQGLESSDLETRICQQISLNPGGCSCRC